MSTILTWSITACTSLAGPCAWHAPRSASCGGRGRRTGLWASTASIVNAMLLLLTFGIRSGSTLYFESRADRWRCSVS